MNSINGIYPQFYIQVVKVKVTQLFLTLCDSMDYTVYGISPGQNTGMSSLSILRGNLPNPGIKPRSHALQVDSLPAEPQGKPKNTGVGRCLRRQTDTDRQLDGRPDGCNSVSVTEEYEANDNNVSQVGVQSCKWK